MKNNFFIFFITLSVFSSVAMADIQSFNPSIEEEDIIFIPTEKEKNMGRSIDAEVKEHYSLFVDPIMQERVEDLGERLAKVADRKDLVYRFTVLKGEEEDNYNAFALPGGYIYIFSDLVDALETDDRIAGVLAHEMGHIEARHPVKRLQAAIGATALMVLTTQMPGDARSKAEANVALGQLMAAYSRHDEKQADELSVKYMKEAGFDPQGSVGALETLQAIRKKGKRVKYNFYRSHPYVSERISDLRKSVKGYEDFDSYINMTHRGDEF